jgi:hypothetical protein
MAMQLNRVPTDDLPASKSAATLAQAKRTGEERWVRLPALIGSNFESARRVSGSAPLKATPMAGRPSRSLDWAQESMYGTLVVTVWRDQIEVEPDGSLSYRIDSLQSPAGTVGTDAAQVQRLRALLTAHVGREVRALLLKRRRDGKDAQKVARQSPDLRNWMLESAGADRFVLRLSAGRKVA